MSGESPLVQERNADSLGEGFLGADNGTGALPFLQVAAPTSAKPDDLVDKVAAGIAELMNAQHYGPYALFLPAKRFAYASTPLSGTMVTPGDRITPLVTGGFHGTGCLPDDDGLLISLGGEPTTIYLGIDATTAFTQIEPKGIYRFRVFERFQVVERDSAAFLRLKFAKRG